MSKHVHSPTDPHEVGKPCPCDPREPASPQATIDQMGQEAMADGIYEKIPASPQATRPEYTNRHGEPCSQACGEGRHSECTETLETCNCTCRGGHTTMHRYMNMPIPAAQPAAGTTCPACGASNPTNTRLVADTTCHEHGGPTLYDPCTDAFHAPSEGTTPHEHKWLPYTRSCSKCGQLERLENEDEK